MAEFVKGDRGHNLTELARLIPPFVGRQEQLDWFTDCIQDVIAGCPRVVLIPGEAGIGKTRLLQEMRADAVSRGAQVYFIRNDAEFALPYKPFIKVLSLLWEQVPADVRETLGIDAEIISGFLYDSRVTFPVQASLPVYTNAEQHQLFQALAHTAIKLAQCTPTLIIFDDLHWVDQPSLDLFGDLVFNIAEMAVHQPIPLLVIGAYRPVEPGSRLTQLVARLQREAICRTLALSSLDESEIRELLQALGSARPSYQLVATVRETTKGNPLFVQELMRHLKQQDALQERGGYVVTTLPAADLRLPQQVTAAILTHTQGLSENCRNALIPASFLGETFSLRSLSAVVDMHDDTLLSLLEEGMYQGLLLSKGQGFQFTHSLIQHVFYHEPSVARRQRLHNQIAKTLEQLYAESLDDHMLEIAYHLVRAGPVANAEKVATYARRAGDQAFAFFAWNEAVHYYEAVLSAAESTNRLSIQQRAELCYWAGFAAYRDQDAGPCLDYYEKAIEAYQLSGDVRGLARVLMDKARTLFTLAAVPYGTLLDVQPLKSVLEDLSANDFDLRGRIEASIAEVYWHAKQTDKARDAAQHALEIGQRISDAAVCFYASHVLALTHIQSLQVKEALASWQNALIYAQQIGDLWLQGWPLQRMPMTLTWLGRLDEAKAGAVAACALAQKTQDWGDYSLALAAQVAIAIAQGDFAAAEKHAHETMLMVSRSHYPWGGALALPALACAHALRGFWAKAEEAIDTLVEPGRVFQDVGPTFQADAWVFRQLVHASAGAVDTVREQLVAHPPEVVDETAVEVGSLARFCALVEIADFIAEPTIAQQSYRVLSLAAQRDVIFSSRWVFLIPRVLGVAAALNHWWVEAEDHFQAAIKAARQIEARPELGRSYLDYARMLVARGRISDCCRAMELVQQADAILREFNMMPLSRRAEQLAEVLQARLPPVLWISTADSDDLDDQEAAVLCRIAGDYTHCLG